MLAADRDDGACGDGGGGDGLGDAGGGEGGDDGGGGEGGWGVATPRRHRGRAGGASKDRWFDGATGGIPPQAKIEEGNRAVILGAGSRCESAAPDRSTAGAL